MKTMNDFNDNSTNKALEEKLIWFAELERKVTEYHELKALLNGPHRLYQLEEVQHTVTKLERELLFHLPTKYRAKYTL